MTSELSGRSGAKARKRTEEPRIPPPPQRFLRELAKAPVLRDSELKSLCKAARGEWSLARENAVETVVAWLLEHTSLRRISIRSEIRTSLVRYTWGTVTAIEVAASFASSAYFSHATAASLHGLLTYNPETIYLNREQSTKPAPERPLDPAAIARAFSNRQRISQDVYSWDTARVAVLSGKNSGRLGVVPHSLDRDSTVNITSVERTLVDLTVRPDYAGGPAQVLEAFRRSQNRVSVGLLLETLRRLDYRYPYHQAMGFYMQRTGYRQTDLAKFAALGMEMDFFVGYGIANREFDPDWRVHYPRGL